jgi:DNA-binding MarR family transcriptional regulator
MSRPSAPAGRAFPYSWQHILEPVRCDLDGARETGSGPIIVLAGILQRDSQSRSLLFDGVVLGDPVWNILLDLFLNAERGEKVMVTSACTRSGASPTTAYRHLRRLESCGVVAIIRDRNDRRRAYVSLTALARSALIEQLAKLHTELAAQLPC